MSLVERAIKKLQESRSTPPGLTTPIAGDSSPVTRPGTAGKLVTQVAAGAAGSTSPALGSEHPRSQSHETARAHETVKVEAPKRVIAIDKQALREMQLLPPVAFERQIASQYQNVKRPLVAAAIGKARQPLPNGHLIMMASALPGEGKTFTSINLALSIAREKDTEIVLVDADVAKPHVSRLFGVQAEQGLLDLLADGQLHADSFILPTDVPGLSILPAGRQVSNATELLASARMEEVVAQLGGSRGRRIVLFDSPPLLLSTESRAIVAAVGQVVLVVRAESTLRSAVADALDLIGEDKPVNLILNQSESPPSSGYYGYGSYGDLEQAAAPQISAATPAEK